jgi:ribosomal protein S7
MTEEEILRDMHGAIQRIDERTEMHTRQIGTIFSMMNSTGCSAGRSNQVAIRWLWTIGSLVTMAIFGVIFYFHVG